MLLSRFMSALDKRRIVLVLGVVVVLSMVYSISDYRNFYSAPHDEVKQVILPQHSAVNIMRESEMLTANADKNSTEGLNQSLKQEKAILHSTALPHTIDSEQQTMLHNNHSNVGDTISDNISSAVAVEVTEGLPTNTDVTLNWRVGDKSNLNTLLNYIIPNSDICTKYQPQVLTWVYSALGNFERRKAIRNTWGKQALYEPSKVVIVFSLAVTTDSHLQKLIEQEQTEYGDIIQDGSFIDAYRNLTYKAQSMLRWSNAYCKNIKLLFKMDDDSFLLPARFSKWVQKFQGTNSWPTNSVIGTVWNNPAPHRFASSKWLVTEKEWPEKSFASKACPGSGYLISGDAIPKLIDNFSKVRFLWLEDMYTTGALASYTKLNYVDNSAHHVFMYGTSTVRHLPVQTSKYLVGHIPNVPEVYKLWERVKGL